MVQPGHEDLRGVWPSQHHWDYAHYGADKGAVVLLINDDPTVEYLAHGDVVFPQESRTCRKTNITGAPLAAGVVDLSAGADPTVVYVAKGDETPVRVIGHHSAVKVSGAVSLGDYLNATTGGVATASTAPGRLTIGRALSAFAGPGAGTVEAILFPLLAGVRRTEVYVSFGSEPVNGQASS